MPLPSKRKLSLRKLITQAAEGTELLKRYVSSLYGTIMTNTNKIEVMWDVMKEQNPKVDFDALSKERFAKMIEAQTPAEPKEEKPKDTPESAVDESKVKEG